MFGLRGNTTEAVTLYGEFSVTIVGMYSLIMEEMTKAWSIPSDVRYPEK